MVGAISRIACVVFVNSRSVVFASYTFSHIVLFVVQLRFLCQNQLALMLNQLLIMTKVTAGGILGAVIFTSCKIFQRIQRIPTVHC